MNIITFLAIRFLKGAAQDKNISFLLKVCFISIFSSSIALTIVTAIMNGFKHETHQKLQGINSDITIKSQDDINFNFIDNILHKEFSDTILSAAPSNISEVIIQNNKVQEKPTNLIFLKGINPQLEPTVSNINQSLIDPKNSNLSNILNNHNKLDNNNIIIGKELANNLKLKVNDKVVLLIPSDNQVQENKILLENYSATISGIFSTGIDEIDEHAAYCSLNLFEKLFDKGVNQINIKLKAYANDNDVIKKLKKRIPLKVYSWKDLYPAVVSALNLEKYAMMSILAIIILIASVNLISLIFMYTFQKQREIAILQSLGLSHNKIIKIFMLLSMIVILSSSIAGLIMGGIICLILEKFPFIKLPDAYFITYLPAKLNVSSILIIFIILIVISLIVSLVSVRKLKNIEISSILKNS